MCTRETDLHNLTPAVSFAAYVCHTQIANKRIKDQEERERKAKAERHAVDKAVERYLWQSSVHHSNRIVLLLFDGTRTVNTATLSGKSRYKETTKTSQIKPKKHFSCKKKNKNACPPVATPVTGVFPFLDRSPSIPILRDCGMVLHDGGWVDCAARGCSGAGAAGLCPLLGTFFFLHHRISV